MEKQTCCICRKEFEGYGNNPWPMRPNGRCCDRCDQMFVIPEKIRLVIKSQEKEKNE